jgi:hypothetical protein
MSDIPAPVAKVSKDDKITLKTKKIQIQTPDEEFVKQIQEEKLKKLELKEKDESFKRRKRKRVK